MTDEALRALEREVERADAPAARLRLAEALWRAGREVAAWEALLPVANAPGPREWLARFPAWSGPGGTPGRTRAVDTAPLGASPPRVERLRDPVDDPQEWVGFGLAAAAAWGLAVWEADVEEVRCQVLDPASGAPRFVLPGPRADWLGPGVLLDMEGQARDAASGEGLGTPPVAEVIHAVGADGTLLIGARREGSPRLHALRWRRDEPADELWAVDYPPARAYQVGVALAPGHAAQGLPGQVVVPFAPGRLFGLDRASGARLWEREGLADPRKLIADERGCLALLQLPRAGAEQQLLALDPAGEVRWSRQDVLARLPLPLAAQDEWLVAESTQGEGLVTLERRDGSLRGSLSRTRTPGWPRPLAVARDAIAWVELLEPGTWGLRAADPQGRSLWALALGPEPLADLAPGPGRLWVVGARGSVWLLRP